MNVLLVDDHPLFREGINHALKRLGEPLEVIFAASASEARQIIQQRDDIALTLLDYHLPDGDGMALLTALLEKTPSAIVIMLSAEQDSERIKAAIGAGAKGFITKSSSIEVILSAIRLVLAGGIYLPLDVLTQSLPLKSAADKTPLSDMSTTDKSTTDKPTALTARQLQVLACMVQGLANKEIARELAMSPSTVKVHVAAILRELEAKNRTQAVSQAKERGLIVTPPH